MPSILTIHESSGEPMPAEYGGVIEELVSAKTITNASLRYVEEADPGKKVPVVLGGSIKRIRTQLDRDKRWFYDDRDNPLHVRQWVYEVILGLSALVLLISFLVIVIGSVRQGKLDLQSFLGATGTFLGGLGVGYGYSARSKRNNSKTYQGEDERQETDAGDDTS